MNKLYAKSMSIEITRRCNMTCTHCLRGDARNLDIDHKDIRNLLKHFKSIQHLCITGGEPSLNPKAIKYILKQLKHFDIHVHRFCIVTNGSQTSLSKEFIDICAELYEYQEERYESNDNFHMLEMSDDRFHDNKLHNQVIKELSVYPFFGFRGQADNIYLFKEGRSFMGSENTIHPIYLNDCDYVYGQIYLNAEGMILSNGDLSYQRQEENVLCHSGSFWSYIKTTLRK